MDACKEIRKRLFIIALFNTPLRLGFLLFLACVAGGALAADSLETTVDGEISVENQVTNISVVDTSSPLITENKARASASPGVNSSDWLKAILGLASVVTLIFVIAWLVKRFTGLAVSNQQQMRIVSAIPVGAKERIALIEVADKQILIGITQHNINLLHSFEEPVVNNNDKSAVDFSSRLQAILSKGTPD